MRKIKRPKIGQYVLVSRWSDRDPKDPWAIGFVDGILQDKNGLCYRVDASPRWFNNVAKITKEEGDEWIKWYGDNVTKRSS